MEIRDRVKEFRRVKASDLIPHPSNYRRHPPAQRSALRGALAEIGFADVMLAWEAPEGLTLVDGHLRQEEMGDQEVPVVVLDFTSQAEADKLLVTLDPLAAMAQVDKDTLLKLLDSARFADEGVNAMLEALANDQLQQVDWIPEADLDGVRPITGVQGYDHKLDPGKLGWRLEAVRSCHATGTALELFAGKGILTYWYRRIFDRVITVDRQAYPGIDHAMTAEDYLAFVMDLEQPLDLVDFDDEGCPSPAIQQFFAAIAAKRWPEFVLSFTDGLGLRIKRRPPINLAASYKWGADTLVKGTRELYALWPSLVEHHITVVAAEAGYAAQRINLARGSGNNVVYASYLIRTGGDSEPGY